MKRQLVVVILVVMVISIFSMFIMLINSKDYPSYFSNSKINVMVSDPVIIRVFEDAEKWEEVEVTTDVFAEIFRSNSSNPYNAPSMNKGDEKDGISICRIGFYHSSEDRNMDMCDYYDYKWIAYNDPNLKEKIIENLEYFSNLFMDSVYISDGTINIEVRDSTVISYLRERGWHSIVPTTYIFAVLHEYGPGDGVEEDGIFLFPESMTCLPEDGPWINWGASFRPYSYDDYKHSLWEELKRMSDLYEAYQIGKKEIL